ncbi:MAG: radical SAM protein [Smithellaceae bacterium]
MNWKQRKKHETLLAQERGYVKKVWGTSHTVCLAYPNTYRVGMANLGFQTVYRILNELPSFLCERLFLSETGGGAESSAGPAEMVSLENMKPPGEFDILAFSISFENDYPCVLQMLDGAGIPLKSADRTDRHPLVIGGGIALTLNCEPVADFFDLFLPGEAEEILPAFARLFAKAQSLSQSRKDMLIALQKEVPGVYVPSLYDVRYLPDGKIASVCASQEGLPDPIRIRPIKHLHTFSTEEVISAAGTEMEDMYLIEVNRGCPRRCRFCAAGHVYTPTRFRRLVDLMPAIDRGLERKKKIGLVGTAVSDHPELLKICQYILDQGGLAGIGSLRADRINEEMVKILTVSGIETVALAPEAGSQRLRDLLCKDISESQILNAARVLLEGGIDQLRLYFMVGLPQEEEADIDAIIDLAKKIRHEALQRADGKKKFRRITLSLNQFIPKPRTPWQRLVLADVYETGRKNKKIADAFRRDKQIFVIHDVPKWNYVQALLSLGDRRAGDILLACHRQGGNWTRALKETLINPDFYVYREKATDEILPWDHLKIG